MTSWNEFTPSAVQEDFDGLLSVSLPFAEEALGRHGEMFPFGVSITLDGEFVMLAADPGLGEQPKSNDVLTELRAGVRQSAESSRAAAYIADVTFKGSDAIRIQMEHRAGIGQTVMLQYRRNRLTKKLRLGSMSVHPGDSVSWV